MVVSTKRVAVVGAGGIGRHHAKWWHVEGAEVCAFVGRREESNAETIATLEALFPFAGRSYTNLTAMLEAERPDIVDVASPHAFHIDHACAALESGADVLCEKPLVFDPAQTSHEMLKQSNDLRDLVRRSGQLFCMCAQMSVGALVCHETWASRSGGEVNRLEFALKSPARAGVDHSHARTWVDLGPHMVAAMLAMFPGGTIEPGSTRVACAENATTAIEFSLVAPERTIPIRMISGKTVGEPKHVRQITINENLFDIGNSIGDDGHYCTCLVSNFGEQKHPDLMRLLIRRFLSGQAVIDIDAAVLNEELVLKIHDVIERG